MSRTRLIVSTIFIVLIGLFAATSLWAGTLKPASPATVATAATISSNAQGAMLMDVDGDTKLDLVVVEPTSPTACGPNATSQVEVFLGNGSGGFGAATVVDIPCGAGNKNPSSAALAHGQLLGGAAHPDDIVVANPSTGDITVLANTSTAGTVNLAPTTNSPYALPGGANPQGLAVADVDGDGNQDIVVADQAKDQLELLLGNSGTAATFAVTTQTASLAAGAAPVTVVAVGTFGSAHGCPATCTTSTVDLATANGNGTASILTNTTVATGTPTFSVANKTVGTSPVAIAAALLGTSGFPDLAVANNGSNNVSVLLNNGSGVFGNASNVSLVGSSPKGVAIGDFNADTNNDIVVADSSGAEILFNNGSGSFATSAAVPPVAAGTGPAGIASGNLNGDSFPDVAVADTGANTVTILLGTPFYNLQKPAIPNQVEGVPSGPIDLITFQYDLSSPTLSADVTDWGDGQSTLGITPTFNAGTSTYTVTGTHTYAEQNAAGETIQITVTDSSVSPNPSFTTSVSIAKVLDGALSPQFSSPADDLAPSSSLPANYNTIVSKFSDQNTSAPITDFAATINWGDGTANSPVDGHPVVIGGSGGTYTVTGSHTYNKAGTFAIVTSIADIEGGNTQTTQTTIHVTIQTLSVNAVPISPTEGISFTGLVANFTSSRAGNKLVDMSATIDWGDCGPAAPNGDPTPGTCAPGSLVAGVVAGADGGPYTVTGTHTYKEANAVAPFLPNYPLIVHVTDGFDGSTATSNTAAATVADAALNPPVLPLLNVPGTEGIALAATTVVANFTDDNTGAHLTDFTASIDWGDCGPPLVAGGPPTPGTCAPGSLVAGTVAGSAGNYQVKGGHKYAEAGTYTIQVQVNDIDGASFPLTPSASAVIADANLAALAAPVLPPNLEGNGTINTVVAQFSDANTLAPACANTVISPPGGVPVPPCDFTANIHWGDGAVSPADGQSVTINGPVGGPYTVSGSHTYAVAEEISSYSITFDVFDVDGNNINLGAGATVTFIDAPLTEVPAFTVGGSQGFPLNPAVPIAAFTDGYATAPLTDFAQNPPASGVLSINWGDGSPVETNVGSIVANGTSGCTFQFCVLPTGSTHKYPNSPNPVNYPITITIKDVGGATATIHSTAIIAPGVLANIPLPGQPISTSNIIPNASLPFVGSFSDTNPDAVPGNFTATIDWGDGTPTTIGVISFICGNGPGSPGPCLAGDSEFNIAGSHTYLTLAGFTVTITVTGGSGLEGPCPACIQTQLNVNSIGAQAFTAQISPQQSQVHVGSSVDLLLTLAPNISGGWPNSVQLGCSGLGTGMACSFVPSSNVPDVLQTRQIHVIVSTTISLAQSTTPPRPGSNGPVQLALLLPAFFGTFGLVLLAPRARKNRRGTILWWTAGLLLLALLLAGCGGGAPVNLGPPANVTPLGVYNVTVTINTLGVTQPVATIQVIK